MSYCHKCGNKGKKGDSFCEKCGGKIREILEDIEEEAEEIVKKTGYRGFVVFILILAIIMYIILDMWAVSQIYPDLSTSSLLTTITNSKENIGLSSSSASTRIIFENPTFVPIILFPIKYEVNYDSNQIAKGKTDFIFISPYSNNTVSANVEISHSAVGLSLLKGITNLFTGNKGKITIDFYELGIKFGSISS